MIDYEKQYIEESGDKLPLRSEYVDVVAWVAALEKWQESFIVWLCKRLEKAEKINALRIGRAIIINDEFRSDTDTY